MMLRLAIMVTRTLRFQQERFSAARQWLGEADSQQIRTEGILICRET